jgi:type 1 fimbria pilin
MNKNTKIATIILGIILGATVIASTHAFNTDAPEREVREGEVLFRGTAVEHSCTDLPGAPTYWVVHVNKTGEDVRVVVAQAILATWGYEDPTIKVGDTVEVYGAQIDGTVVLRTPWQTENHYYIKKC